MKKAETLETCIASILICNGWEMVTDFIPNETCIAIDQTNKKGCFSMCGLHLQHLWFFPSQNFRENFYNMYENIIEIFHSEGLRYVIFGNIGDDWETFKKNASFEEEYTISYTTVVMF